MNKSALGVLLGSFALGAAAQKIKAKGNSNRLFTKRFFYNSRDESFLHVESIKELEDADPSKITTLSVCDARFFDGGPNTDLKKYSDIIIRASQLFPNLKGLDLSCFIPEPWKYAPLFPKLEFFKVNDNDEFANHWYETGTWIPDDIIKHPKIMGLILQDCHLEEVPKELSKMTNLQYLSLSNNPIFHSVPVNTSKSYRRLGKLKNLKQLVMIDTGLSIIPSEITGLENLERLILNRNKISYIPQSIVKLENLIDLRLSFNPILVLPDYICEMTNLRRLDIKNTMIDSLPNHFGRLKNCLIFNLVLTFINRN